MHFGVKKYQKHICFYAKTDDAIIEWNGEMIPNQYYLPNFDLPLSNIYPCEKGVFYCRVYAFYG